MQNKTVMIADDEQRIRKLISDFLQREGYTVLEADNGQSTLALFAGEKIDLVILDVMMPEPDGLTVCREIRKKSSVPIIMLTARGEELDQLFAFELGADEYVTKPFSPKVLTARVNALFRRLESEKTLERSSYGLSIDTESRLVCLDAQPIELSPKEYDLLAFLFENRGKALSRQQILNQVWNFDYYGDLRTVDTHINRLRSKLGEGYIHTVWGVGYRFEVLS